MGPGLKLWVHPLLTALYLSITVTTGHKVLSQIYLGSSSKSLLSGSGRSLLAGKRPTPLTKFLNDFGIEDEPEMNPDHSSTKEKFFLPDKEAVIHNEAARRKSKQQWRDKHIADAEKYKNQTSAAAKLPSQKEDELKQILESYEAEKNSATEVVVEGQYKRKHPAKSKRKEASVRKRERRSGQDGSGKMPLPSAPPWTEGCKIYILDLDPIAKKQGIPTCEVSRLSTHPLTQRLLPHPLRAVPSAKKELSEPPGNLEWTFPFTAWPHNKSQHAAPWYLKEAIKSSPLHTINISESTIVLVDDYCYLTWAIADLNAKGHWWLDVHKHYESNHSAGQHLLDVYHAMAHQNEFMQKQARNFLFVTPLTSFDFGEWKPMDDYVAMACEHFSNSMHVVFDQAQRWRCGRYRPDRTLVAPLSVTESVEAPPQDADRDLTLVFRGNCDPDVGKEPQFSGKRLRRYLVKLYSNSGNDVSVSCTNEDHSGAGPSAVSKHHILSHTEYMHEMGRSKFCIMIPGTTQNTPRLTEVFLAGCVPVFIGPPWHAMPYPEVVDWRAAAITIHMADISRWANFGAKWVLERNAPRDASRLHPKWWTPQVSAKDMDELHSLTDLLDFLRDYPEELYLQKKAAVYNHRSLFLWAGRESSPPQATDVALQQVCSWGQEESRVVHLDMHD